MSAFAHCWLVSQSWELSAFKLVTALCPRPWMLKNCIYLSSLGEPRPSEKDGCFSVSGLGYFWSSIKERSCPSEVSPSLTPGYLHPIWASLVRLGMWQITWKWFYRKWMEAGFCLMSKGNLTISVESRACLSGSEKRAATCFSVSGPPELAQPLPSALPCREPGSQKWVLLTPC